MYKDCLSCGNVFEKTPTRSLKNWNERAKFCSKDCHDSYRKGKPSPSPSTTFKKGQITFVPPESRKRGAQNNKWKGGPIEKSCIICRKQFFAEKYRSETQKSCSLLCSNEYRASTESRNHLHKVHKERVLHGKHNLYRGISSLVNIIRHCSQYKQWRDSVFQRDEFTCKFCYTVGRKLNADHIKQFSLILIENNIKTFEQAILCKELWDINNGRTLCLDCHTKTETFARRLPIKIKN